MARWQALKQLVPADVHDGPISIDPQSWTALGEDLFARYAAPQRVYHSPSHVLSVLHVLATLCHPQPPTLAVQLAAFFHDAIYDPTATPNENELQSARLATESLGALGVHACVVTAVASLIEATAGHVVNGSPGCPEFLDADLCILGSAEGAYDTYAQAIRAEYSHVPDAAFRSGRAAILHRFLNRDMLFYTAAGRGMYEEQARKNLAREIQRLEEGGRAQGF